MSNNNEFSLRVYLLVIYSPLDAVVNQQ